jgi:hypothetical protein
MAPTCLKTKPSWKKNPRNYKQVIINHYFILLMIFLWS